MLLGTAGILGRQPWLLGGAALAAGLTAVVVQFGRAYDRRRAEIKEARSELKSAAQEIAAEVRSPRDS